MHHEACRQAGSEHGTFRSAAALHGLGIGHKAVVVSLVVTIVHSDRADILAGHAAVHQQGNLERLARLADELACIHRVYTEEHDRLFHVTDSSKIELAVMCYHFDFIIEVVAQVFGHSFDLGPANCPNPVALRGHVAQVHLVEVVDHQLRTTNGRQLHGDLAADCPYAGNHWGC